MEFFGGREDEIKRMVKLELFEFLFKTAFFWTYVKKINTFIRLGPHSVYT